MNNETTMTVYAVISGTEYEGEAFDDLRLFASASDADAYAAELRSGFSTSDRYVLVEQRQIG